MSRLEDKELKRLFINMRVAEALIILVFISLILPIFSYYYLPSRFMTESSIIEIILISPFVFTSYSINFILSPLNVIYVLLSYSIFRYANHKHIINIKTIGYINLSIFVFYHIPLTGVSDLREMIQVENSLSLLNWATFLGGVFINYYFAVIIFKKTIKT